MIMYLTQYNASVKKFYLKYASTLDGLETAEFFIMKTLEAGKSSKLCVPSSKRLIQVCQSRGMCAVEVELKPKKDEIISSSLSSG